MTTMLMILKIEDLHLFQYFSFRFNKTFNESNMNLCKSVLSWVSTSVQEVSWIIHLLKTVGVWGDDVAGWVSPVMEITMCRPVLLSVRRHYLPRYRLVNRNIPIHLTPHTRLPTCLSSVGGEGLDSSKFCSAKAPFTFPNLVQKNLWYGNTGRLALSFCFSNNTMEKFVMIKTIRI